MPRFRALLLLTVLLSGCWSRVELNDLGVVTAIAVDVGDQESVRLTLYFARSSAAGHGRDGQSQGPQQSAGVIAREAPNLLEALRNISLASPRRISLHHVAVILASQEYARNSIEDLTDFTARHPQLRLHASPMVVLGKADDVLETRPMLETLQSENIYEIIQAKGVREQRLKEFLIARSSKTHSGWMYAVRVVERPAKEDSNAPDRAVEIAGAALFLGDRMVLNLDQQEMRPLSWLLSSPRDMYLTAPCPGKQGGTFTLRVDEVKPDLRPSVAAGKIAFEVNARVITELMRKDCAAKVRHAEDREQMEAEAERVVRDALNGFVSRAQKAGVDPVGFGKRLQLAYPAYWRRIEGQWPKLWPNADVRTTAEVRIRMSGLLVRPANKTEEELTQ